MAEPANQRRPEDRPLPAMRPWRELVPLLKRFARYPLRERWLLARTLLIMLLITATALAAPWVHRAIIDDALLARDAPLLWSLVGVLLVLVAARFALSFLRALELMRLRIKILYRVRRDVVEHLQFLPLAFHRRTSPGYLLARIGSDIEQLAPLFGDSLLGLAQNVLLIVFGVPLVFLLDWKLALFVLALVPLYLLNHYAFAGPIRRLSGENQERWARVWARIEENLLIIPSVKLFGRELFETLRYLRAARAAVRGQVRLTLVQTAGALTTEVFTGLGPIAVLAFAGAQIIRGAMSLGDLIAFSVYMGMLIGPVRSVFSYGLGVQGALASLERVYDLLDRPREISADDGAKERLEGCRGAIEVRGLCFAYEEGAPVLEGLDLRVEPGELVVLEGANGSGKTTLVALLVGLLEPQAGEVRIDGVPLGEVSKRALRERVGVVFRDNFFFNASIRENIAYGRAGASDEAVEAAAGLARVTDFAAGLPEGLDTPLGERGEGLSRGQLQRVALARTLLRDPAVLVLDEGTTSIDRSSRALIQRSVERFRGQKTVIVISHEDTWQRADRTFVLEGGRLRERSTPAGAGG